MNKNYIKHSMILYCCITVMSNNILPFPESEDFLETFNQECADQDDTNHKPFSFQDIKNFAANFYPKDTKDENSQIIALIEKQNKLLEEQKNYPESIDELKKTHEEFMKDQTFSSLISKYAMILCVGTLCQMIIKNFIGTPSK